MRISVYILLFLVFTNALAVAFDASGMDDHLGIQPSTGSPDQLERAQNQAPSSVDPGSGGSDLFNFWVNLGDTLSLLINGIFPAAKMFSNAGAPDWMVAYAFSGIGIIGVIDFLAFLRGGSI